MDCVLGIDTSNYTTSLAMVSVQDGRVFADVRRLLPVSKGMRGLRQSEALFHHVERLPGMMDSLISECIERYHERPTWRAVGVSVRPRPLSSSYMPVFRAGESFAQTFARAVGIPCFRASHQEGHVAAAMHFLTSLPYDERFIAVHISGGTSDVLLANQSTYGYRIDSLGEGSDLHAGQFVDRVGVTLGLSFPAGPQLERLAEAATRREFRLPASVDGCKMSFSGPCTAALRSIQQGVPPEEVAWAVQQCVANSVVKAVGNALYEHPSVTSVVIAGGVASNSAIRHRIEHRLRISHPNAAVYFAPPKYASDNGLGAAVIACRSLVGMSSGPAV